MKVFFDYRAGKTRSSKNKTIELGPWLDLQSTKKMLYDYRCFYVLKPNIDSMVKFGIAGLDGKAGAWGRLHQYINEYGYETELNKCSGIRLLYLVGTKYSPNVETTNTAVFKKELQCKKYFRDSAVKGRGYERILEEKLEELFKLIDDTSNQSWEDTETNRRTSERLQQAEITPDDKVTAIVSHETKPHPSKAKTKYLVRWSRPYILTEKKRVKGKIETTTREVYETLETYEKLLTYLDGLTSVKLYKEAHPSSKFRD